jgi:hypothetical protein
MATKRMFDKAIIDMDKFMDLPLSAKAIYFLLGMEADDEGFVSFKKVMRIHGGNDDDVKILVAKGLLIYFESGVVVITDWNKNNWLDSRRIKPTEYQKEKKLLDKIDGSYCLLSNGLASIEEKSIEEKSIEEKSGFAKQNSLIPEIIKLFEEINPACNRMYGNTTQRKACQDLIDNYGFERLQSVISKTLPKTNALEFFPNITTPLQLWDKWASLESSIFKYKNKKNKNFRGLEV